jgi:broad-specificity NMP kinase
LKYVARENIDVKVVELIKERQNRRMKVDISRRSDKLYNPLIAIPGSPGIGKSTFFAHFPESEAYINYSLNKSSKEAAIVSTFTFNNGMEYRKDVIGLRIIYGTLLSMGLLSYTHKFANFKLFLKEFFEQGLDIFEDGYDSIIFLQKIFGENRKFLLLVDELSKANNDKEVMRNLGDILNNIDNCDVVVSSLSPRYIDKLLTGSQRSINYIILPPLLYSNLGKEECKIFYKKILQNAESKNIIFFSNDNDNNFKKKIIENSYLLCSGHPRTIERLIDYMDNIGDKDINKFINFLKSRQHLQLSDMVFEFCDLLINKIDYKVSIQIGRKLIFYYDDYPTKFFSNVLFSHPLKRSAEDEKLSYELEHNLVMMFKQIGPQSFLTSVQAFKLLDFISEFNFDYKNTIENDKLLSNGLILLNELKIKNKFKNINEKNKNNENVVMSTSWWARFVDLTILGYSYQPLKNSIFDVFGIQKNNNNKSVESILDEKNNWKIDVVSVKNLNTTFATVLLNNTKTTNILIIPNIENQTGFDSCVVLHVANTKLIFYLQMKIGKTSNTKLKTNISNAIFQVIKTHIEVKKENKNDVLINDNNDDFDFHNNNEINNNKNDVLIDDDNFDLNNVHIVYYNWDADDDDDDVSSMKKITKQDLLTETEAEKKNKYNSYSQHDLVYLKYTQKFIEKYFFTNIHFVDHFQLKEWLNPSFLPFPILLTNIGVNNNNKINDD